MTYNEELVTQLRDITTRIKKVEEYQDAVDLNQAETTPEIIPSMNNFLNNSDFTYPDSQYNGASYAGASTTLADWYVRNQGSTISYTKNTTTVKSGEAIDQISAGAKWEHTRGAVLLSSNFRIGHPLPKKYGDAGNYINVRMQLSKAGGTNIDSDVKLKVSLWDNTDNRVIRGTKPVLTLNKIGSHSGGTVTRNYILEVQMPDGTRFYSDVISSPSVTNCISTGSVSRTNYVEVSWAKVNGATRYRLYRWTSEFGIWNLIETVVNGVTNVSDYGGSGGGTFTPPTSFNSEQKEYQRAECFVTNLGSFLLSEDTVYEVAMGFYIPSAFAINGEQYIQIEVLKSDYTDSTSAEMDDYSLRIDKVGLSYTNGRWTPSPKDQTTTSTPTTPTTPIVSGGGGDGGNVNETVGGDAGGGLFERERCVVLSTSIKLWDGSELPAGNIVVGDILKSWDGKEWVPAVVRRVVRAKTSRIITFYTDSSEVMCSFSHRFITGSHDLRQGTTAYELLKKAPQGASLLIEGEHKPEPEKIVGYEVVEEITPVVSFELDRGRRVFIGNGVMMHNRKIDEYIFL